jgi:DNA-binding XRE family transcriptional regulator
VHPAGNLNHRRGKDMSRNIDISAAEFATVRATLGDSQGQFAERLGVSRRTVIRGEQRGIELPRSYGWGRKPDSTRGQLADKWKAARATAESFSNYVDVAESEPIKAILARMSQDEKNRGYTYSQNWHAQQFAAHVEQVKQTKVDRSKHDKGTKGRVAASDRGANSRGAGAGRAGATKGAGRKRVANAAGKRAAGRTGRLGNGRSKRAIGGKRAARGGRG